MRTIWMAICALSVSVVVAEEVMVETTATDPVVVTEKAPVLPASIGAFIGITAGGDIEDSEVAYGGQVKLPLSDIFFVELSASQITDTFVGEDADIDQDLTSIGISIGAEVQAATRCKVYGLFGPNFNMADLDISFNRELPPGASITDDVDDAIGFHAAAGSTYRLAEHLTLFLEYRYTFLDLEGSFTATRSDGNRLVTEFEGSYDFGIAKLGLSYLF